MSFRADRLKTLREQKGWSMRELALRCGLADTMIRKYESSDAEPNSSSLVKICEMLEVSSDYLLGLSDNPIGQFGSNALSVDDEILLRAFHREGWAGVIHLGADQLSGRKSE